MGVFKRNGHINPEGLDWYMLQNGWVSLYWRTTILDEDIKWLETEKYVIIEFNCKNWDDDEIMHSQFKEKLDFPDYYGENWSALCDCLSDLNIIKAGLVFVFRHLDHMKKQTATTLLNIMADNARLHMLFGHRIITLAQVDNPDYELEPIGRTLVSWNGREWLNSKRVLE